MYRTERVYKVLGIPLFKLKTWRDSPQQAIEKTKPAQKAMDEDKTVDSKPVSELLRVAIRNGGGLGDSIMDVAFIQNLRRHLPFGSRVDYFAKTASVFASHPALDRVSNDTSSLKKADYDIVLIQHRFFIVDKLDEEKTRRLSPVLFEFCQHLRELKDTVLKGTNDNNGLYTMYAELLGKNRWEQMDLKSITGFDRHSPVYMPIAESAFSVLERNCLKKFRYITIDRGVDSNFDSKCPKLWPLGHYHKLVAQLKENFPDITIVQIGANDKFGTVGADIELLGKTSLEETKVLLKNSLLHIDVEGGLIHLNHALHGKSLVIFGPTPVKTFGYDNNINLTSNACPGTCHWVIADWQKKCLRGFDESPCMAATQPDRVFSEAAAFLKSAMKRPALVKTEKFTTKGHVLALVGFSSSQDVPEDILRENDCTFFNDRYEAESGQYKTRLGNRYNLMADGGEFDAVVCYLESSCRTNDAILDECIRIMKDGGKLTVIYSSEDNAGEYYLKKKLIRGML